jgi:hypothetical protein
MESLDDSKMTSKMGFFKYLFKFDDDVRHDLTNIVQYALIAFIPVILLNKGMQRFVPEADEEKGSLEILAEVLIQIVVIFVALFYINRIIVYVPTYSGQKYPEFTLISIILAVLMITMSLQTKLGEKVSILSDRAIELWDGSGSKKKKGKGKSSQSNTPQNPVISQGPTQEQIALYQVSNGTTSINQLPKQVPTQDMSGGNGDQQYGGSSIMAANEVLGGSAFGANF